MYGGLTRARQQNLSNTMLLNQTRVGLMDRNRDLQRQQTRDDWAAQDRRTAAQDRERTIRRQDEQDSRTKAEFEAWQNDRGRKAAQEGFRDAFQIVDTVGQLTPEAQRAFGEVGNIPPPASAVRNQDGSQVWTWQDGTTRTFTPDEVAGRLGGGAGGGAGGTRKDAGKPLIPKEGTWLTLAEATGLPLRDVGFDENGNWTDVGIMIRDTAEDLVRKGMDPMPALDQATKTVATSEARRMESQLDELSEAAHDKDDDSPERQALNEAVQKANQYRRAIGKPEYTNYAATKLLRGINELKKNGVAIDTLYREWKDGLKETGIDKADAPFPFMFEYQQWRERIKEYRKKESEAAKTDLAVSREINYGGQYSETGEPLYYLPIRKPTFPEPAATLFRP